MRTTSFKYSEGGVLEEALCNWNPPNNIPHPPFANVGTLVSLLYKLTIASSAGCGRMQRVAVSREDSRPSVEWEIEDGSAQPLQPTTPLNFSGDALNNTGLRSQSPMRGWALQQVGML